MSSEVIKKLVTRKFKKDKDSPEEEITTEKEYQRKETQAVKPVANHFYTWQKIADAKKEGAAPAFRWQCVFVSCCRVTCPDSVFASVPYEGEFIGHYTGSYRDLKREFLTVKVPPPRMLPSPVMHRADRY